MNTQAGKFFMALYLVFFMGLLTLVILFDKADLHLLLTRDYVAAFDSIGIVLNNHFFKEITHVGAFVPFVVAAGLLFYRVGDALFLLLSEAATALVVFPLKYIIAAPRPSLFFATYFPEVSLHQVPGVTLYQMLSFPSGHTATVFCFMLSLTLICKKRPFYALPFFILAVLTGYSRIYLSQHFAVDVLAGSFIGVVMTLLVYFFYQRQSFDWQNQSLVQLFNKKR